MLKHSECGIPARIHKMELLGCCFNKLYKQEASYITKLCHLALRPQKGGKAAKWQSFVEASLESSFFLHCLFSFFFVENPPQREGGFGSTLL